MLNYANFAKTDIDEIVLDGGFKMQVALHRGLVLNVVFEIDDNGLLTVPINDSITKKFAKITSSSDKLYLIDI